MADSLLTFPCEFTIKAFGLASEEFEAAVLGIIRQHVSESPDARLNKNGKYLALSITIRANSQEQLDSIYRDLSANPHVVMAL